MAYILRATALCISALSLALAADEGLRRDQMVDLAATLSASPENPVAGETVHLSLQLANQGQAAASGISIVLFADNRRVASAAASLEAFRTTVVPLSWVPPKAGVYSLAAVFPQNSANLTIAVADPNSRTAAFSISGLHAVNSGVSRTLQAEVRNTGSSTASVPVSFQAQGVVLGTVLAAGLAPGATATVAVPFPESRGSARVTAVVNPRFRAASTAQNIGATNDLRVDQLSLHFAQYDPMLPRRVTLSFRVVNAGLSPVTTSFRTRISPGLVQNGALADDFLSITSLAPAEAVSVSRTLDSPLAEFDVRVETDVDHTTGDMDLSNNVATAHFKNPSPLIDQWFSIGPRRVVEGLGAVGALFQVAIDPTNAATMYASGFGMGIWKTLDNAASWQPITDALPSLNVAAIAVDPQNSQQIYAATNDFGLFRSTDGGGSWRTLDNPNTVPAISGQETLRVHPTNSNILYLKSATQGIFVYHADAAASKWNLTLSGSALDLVLEPGQPNHVYATLGGAAAGVYLSIDSGATWTQQLGCPGGSLPTVMNPKALTLAFSKGVIYAALRTAGQLDVYRTTGISCSIGGQMEHSWEKRFSISGDDANSLFNRIDADPADPNFVYLSGVTFRVSTDGAGSFNVSDGPHADHHAFAVPPGSPRTIVVACDGGLYRSTNRGASGSWQFIGEGILNLQFYHFSLAATDPLLTLGGTQDNGTVRYTGSTIWDEANDGDGATTAIDPTNPQIQYSMHQGPDDMVKRVGNGSWNCTACGLPIATNCPRLYYQLVDNAPLSVLASCNSLFRADSPACTRCPKWNPDQDVGAPNVWTPILPQSAITGSVFRSAVDPTVNLYYAGTTSGQVWAGTGGANWKLLFTGAAGVRDIAIDRDDPQTVYVAFDGTTTQRVYRLRRSAPAPDASTVVATDLTSNLAIGLTVQAITSDRMHPFTVFAGTNQGVYRGRSIDGGATWTWAAYLNGLPLADVRTLAVHPMTGALRVATFGRGAYEVNTDSPVGSLLTAAGRVTFLRVHDPGTGYGPPNDFLDVEVVIQLDTLPGRAFGFQLRPDSEEAARHGMLDLLRSAFRSGNTVSIDYIRTGLRNGRIIRVQKLN